MKLPTNSAHTFEQLGILTATQSGMSSKYHTFEYAESFLANSSADYLGLG